MGKWAGCCRQSDEYLKPAKGAGVVFIATVSDLAFEIEDIAEAHHLDLNDY